MNRFPPPRSVQTPLPPPWHTRDAACEGPVIPHVFSPKRFFFGCFIPFPPAFPPFFRPDRPSPPSFPFNGVWIPAGTSSLFLIFRPLLLFSLFFSSLFNFFFWRINVDFLAFQMRRGNVLWPFLESLFFILIDFPPSLFALPLGWKAPFAPLGLDLSRFRHPPFRFFFCLFSMLVPTFFQKYWRRFIPWWSRSLKPPPTLLVPPPKP